MRKITIIGGGPGGYVAAFAAAKKGMEVTLIEQKHLGGTCLNYGCIPTKTIKASADALETALNLKDFGLELDEKACVNMPAVLARKEKVRSILENGLVKACAKHGVNYIQGTGYIKNKNEVQATTATEILSIASDVIIIATGSKVREIPSLPFDGKYILSSDDMLDCAILPQKLLIVGGGVVGCEMAFIYKTFGVDVSVVEGQSRLLPIPSVDKEISTLIQKEMKKKRIGVELGRTLQNIRVENEKVCGELAPLVLAGQEPPSKPKINAVEYDMVLVTVGRSPCTENMGLENVGVKLDKQGWIEVNEHLQSSVDNIYAIGDVIGPEHVMLAHVASAEGLHVINALNGELKPMDYKVVPSAIFTSPEVGCVGQSEEQLLAQGRDIKCTTFQLRELGKIQASGHLSGIIKLIADAQSGELLGAHMAGEHASDLMAETALCMQMNGTVQDIANTIHAHPTIAEGVFEAAVNLYEPQF